MFKGIFWKFFRSNKDGVSVKTDTPGEYISPEETIVNMDENNIVYIEGKYEDIRLFWKNLDKFINTEKSRIVYPFIVVTYEYDKEEHYTFVALNQDNVVNIQSREWDTSVDDLAKEIDRVPTPNLNDIVNYIDDVKSCDSYVFESVDGYELSNYILLSLVPSVDIKEYIPEVIRGEDRILEDHGYVDGSRTVKMLSHTFIHQTIQHNHELTFRYTAEISRSGSVLECNYSVNGGSKNRLLSLDFSKTFSTYRNMRANAVINIDKYNNNTLLLVRHVLKYIFGEYAAFNDDGTFIIVPRNVSCNVYESKTIEGRYYLK